MSRIYRKRSGDARTDNVVRPVQEAVDDLNANPLLSGGGTLLRDVVLSDGGDTMVPHKLGRQFTSYEVRRVRGATAAGYVTEASGADKTTHLKLTASGYGADITVDIYVH